MGGICVVEHPLILGKKADFARTAEFAGRDAFVKGLFARARAKAETLLEQRAYTRMADEINLDAEFNRQRLDILSFVYYMTREEKYLRRTLEELDAICALGSWQSFKFLNTASFALGAATAFDRLYDALDDGQRRLYAGVIYEKALKPAMRAYDASDAEAERDFGALGWSRCKTNWNAVCNGAILAACAAVSGEYPAQAEKITACAANSLGLFTNVFAEDGGFSEGISYWFYAMLYLMHGISAAENCGAAAELPLTKGFVQSAYYADAMNFGKRNFNFHDVGTECRIDTSPIMYFAARFGLGELARRRVRAFDMGWLPVADEVNVSDMLFYRDFGGQTDAAEDICIKSIDTAVLSCGDIGIALHGGANNAVHGHLDCGSIIVDALGERWICDLGKEPETYTLRGAAVNRWNYYRMRAEGHNCIVINPCEKPDQLPEATAPIADFAAGVDYSRAALELAECYEEARVLRREVYLDKINRTALITDHIELEKECTVYSFLHTRAGVRLTKDGFELHSNGKRITAHCSHAASAEKAEPLPGSPNVPHQADNAGVTKIVFRLDNTKKADIRIKFEFGGEK